MSEETPKSWLGRIGSTLRDLGGDALALAGLGSAAPTPDASGDAEDAARDSDEKVAASQQRFSMLQGVANQLRGAADGYIAAKLDEIEARVDLKLNEISAQIDEKTAHLLRQLEEARDRELRHRLRILKLTLLFTVLVALLSLGYKWLDTVLPDQM